MERDTARADWQLHVKFKISSYVPENVHRCMLSPWRSATLINSLAVHNTTAFIHNVDNTDLESTSFIMYVQWWSKHCLTRKTIYPLDLCKELVRTVRKLYIVKRDTSHADSRLHVKFKISSNKICTYLRMIESDSCMCPWMLASHTQTFLECTACTTALMSTLLTIQKV